MSSTATVNASAAGWTRYRRPQLAAARFTGSRMMRTGAVWGLVFGLYVYDNAVAFHTIAPTTAQRDASCPACPLAPAADRGRLCM